MGARSRRSILHRAARCVCLTALIFAAALPAAAQSRIKFNNQQLFLNGTNIAWVNFANDLGPGALDTVSFRTVFDSIHAHGGNALRFWLHTTGGSTPQFSIGGRVIGPGVNAIADLKKVLDMAWQRKIGLLLSLWSFDMMDTANGGTVTNRSELMLTDTSYTRSYINNSLIPMVNAVRGHPAIIAWEVFNEPEGMSNEFGWSTTYHVPMVDIQTFTNLVAGAIHRTDSTAKVTTGSWALTAGTDVNGLAKTDIATRLRTMSTAEKAKIESDFAARYGFRQSAAEILTPLAGPNMNYYRDDRLVAAGGDPLGTFDFYTSHYYSWQSTPISPFVHPYSAWSLTKPLVIAEFFPEQTLDIPFTSLYEDLYAGGYAGALSWGWYSGATGHSQPVLQSNTLVLVQDLFSNFPQDIDPVPFSGKVYSFTATPGIIDSGQTSILSWKTATGTTVTLNGSSVAINGTLSVTPAVTTAYRLIAAGTVTDTTVVSVTVYPSGRIISFSASNTSVAIGDPVRLTWNVSHGSTVSLNDSVVRPTDAIVVHPSGTTTYKLRAAGSVHDSSSILVTAIPVDKLNRALLKPVSVSSSSTNPTFANPQNMVDGDTTTTWVSGTRSTQYVNLDLGQNFLIRRVIVRWGDNYASAWRLAFSPDNSMLNYVLTTTTGTGGTTIVDSMSQSGRYVNIELDTQAPAATGFAIRELEVYGNLQITSVAGPAPGAPDKYALLQNYPNPFNPSTTISFALPVRSTVSIAVYNLLGQRVAELAGGEMETGYHSVVWNAGVASGVYFCRMEARASDASARHFAQTMKLMVLR